MKKCELCGEEYKENKNIIYFMPKNLIEKIRFIPSCECYKKKQQEEFEAQELKLEKERIENRIKKYLNISVVDNKFKEASFINADMEETAMIIAKKYAEKFTDKNIETGIIFYGNPGTGKTFASACISNFLMDKGKTVLALSLSSYLSKLKKEWGEAEADILKHVKQCDLLVLDDFGSEHKTDWAISKVFALIDTRYRTGKPMIITTNLDYQENNNCEITKNFSIDGKDRIKDRIKEMCFPVKLTGESKRKINKDDFISMLMQ
ncbi:MAG: ATP-binding protein [Fusobacteriaceae bacterium]